MKDFQLRVVKEKEELEVKIKALADFKNGEQYKKLPQAERIDLTKQLRLMRGYAQVLISRISRFDTK